LDLQPIIFFKKKLPFVVRNLCFSFSEAIVIVSYANVIIGFVYKFMKHFGINMI